MSTLKEDLSADRPMMVRCPRCQVNLRQDRLQKHFDKVHADEPPLEGAFAKLMMEPRPERKSLQPARTPRYPKLNRSRSNSMDGVNVRMRYEVDEFGTVHKAQKLPWDASARQTQPNPRPAEVITKYPLAEPSAPARKVHHGVLCPYCKGKFTERGLTRHMKVSHPIQFSDDNLQVKSGAEKRSPLPKATIQCQVCGEIVPKRQFESHVRKVHFGQPVAQPEPEIKKPIPNEELVQCPHCPSMVNAKRLQTHIQKVHGPKRVSGPAAKKSPATEKQPVMTRHPVSSSTIEISSKVVCPYCKELFTERGLNRHIKLTHHITVSTIAPAPPSNPDQLVKCALCNAKVAYKNLQKHYRKAHPGKDPSLRMSSSRSNSSRTSSSHTSSSKSKPKEAFRQAFDEPRDGSKHLGQLRRENGRFGSFPLHDDYGDESEA